MNRRTVVVGPKAFDALLDAARKVAAFKVPYDLHLSENETLPTIPVEYTPTEIIEYRRGTE